MARLCEPRSRATACLSMSCASATSIVASVAGAPNGMTGIVCSSVRAPGEHALSM